MTDESKYPSRVRIKVNGEVTGTYMLDDDPADHRGILSWYFQPKNNKLSEAGSYGYLINTPIPVKLISTPGTITIRLEVDESLPGGLALYSEKFGRYPLDPTLVFIMK
jgi:predicted transcriptional regulator